MDSSCKIVDERQKRVEGWSERTTGNRHMLTFTQSAHDNNYANVFGSH